MRGKDTSFLPTYIVLYIYTPNFYDYLTQTHWFLARDVLWMPHRQTVADWSAVVKNIHGKPRMSDGFRKLIDYLCQMVKRVSEMFPVGTLCESESREVGSNQVELACQFRHQFTKHVTAAWETMQQQNGRILWIASLTIKDFTVFNLIFFLYFLKSALLLVADFRIYTP